MNAIIGKNLKAFREFNSFSQERIAQFLGLQRSAYSNYETGEREAPLDILERCANIYGCELYMFFEENENSSKDMLVCAFRVDDISDEDMAEVAKFKNVVKNYIKLNSMLER